MATPSERDPLVPHEPPAPSSSKGGAHHARDEEAGGGGGGGLVGKLQIVEEEESAAAAASENLAASVSTAGACGSSPFDMILCLLRPLPSICLMALLNLMMAVPFGSTILSPVLPFGESARQGIGMRMSLLALVVGQFSLGSLPCGLSSAIESVTPWQMGELSPFYHELAELAARNSTDDVETLSTTLFLFSLSTLAVGGTFYVLGKAGVASVTYFFPTYCMLGLVGGVGVWLITLSAQISVSPSRVDGGSGDDDDDRWWDAAMTWPYLLSVVFVAGLVVLRRFIPKDRFPLLDPCYFLCVPFVFYSGLWAMGISIDEAVDAGYMFKEPPTGEENVGGPANDISPWELWESFDLAKVNWVTVVPAAPTLIAASVLTVVLVAPFIPPLAALKGMDEFDMNHEFKAHGYANIISGLVSPGGLALSMSYSTSAVYSRAGGKGKIPSAVLSFAIFLTFLYGPLVVDWLPRCLAGALILDMGINLFFEGVLDPENKSDRIEYASIWIILVVMNIFSMTAALVAGLAMALVTHALQSQMGQEPVRIARDASTLRSSHWRNPAALALLADPVKGRKNIAIFMLQGHIFFGNMNKLQKQVFEFLQKKMHEGDGGASMVILDFTLVVGIDSSALVFVDKLKSQMQKKLGVSTVVYVNATKLKPPHLLTHNVSPPSELLVDDNRRSLSLNQSKPKNQRMSLAGSYYMPQPAVAIDGRFFESLDEALVCCEDALISRHKPGLERERTDMLADLSLMDSNKDDEMEKQVVMDILEQRCGEASEDLLGAIFSVLTRETFTKGHVLWNIGERTDSAKLLLRGSVFAFVDENDPTTFRETIKVGAFMGLRGLILGEKHLATVRCEMDTVMYSLDEQGYRRLLAESPSAARLLDLSVARYLSHRLQHVSNRIYESKSLPL